MQRVVFDRFLSFSKSGLNVFVHVFSPQFHAYQHLKSGLLFRFEHREPAACRRSTQPTVRCWNKSGGSYQITNLTEPKPKTPLIDKGQRNRALFQFCRKYIFCRLLVTSKSLFNYWDSFSTNSNRVEPYLQALFWVYSPNTPPDYISYTENTTPHSLLSSEIVSLRSESDHDIECHYKNSMVIRIF